jgi:hypothetical protein
MNTIGDRGQHLLGNAGDDTAGVGVPGQHDVLQAFVFDQVDDVGDVGVEIDGGRQEMDALAEAGERRGVDLVAALFEPVGHPPPAPAAVPGAVHQHEGPRLGLSLCGLNSGRRGGAERCSGGQQGAPRCVGVLGHR